MLKGTGTWRSCDKSQRADVRERPALTSLQQGVLEQRGRPGLDTHRLSQAFINRQNRLIQKHKTF